MKKTLLISMLALLGMTQAVAQEYEYVPFVREGVKWVYYITNYHGGPSDYDPNPRTIYRTLEIKGDTVINGKSYKIMHKYDGDGFNLESEKDEIPIFLREEDKIVYGLVPEGTMYYDLQDCLIGDTRFIPFETVYSGAEFVLYDFNDPVAFWTSLVDNADDGHQYDHISMDTIVVGNHLAKRYVGEVIGEFEIIEGIGYSGHSSYPLGAFQGSGSGVMSAHTYFSHVIEDGKIIYKTDNYNDDSYVPFVREGVKWVYRISNYQSEGASSGESSFAYRILEFKGDTIINGKTYKAMHKYSGSSINESNDTIPIYMREENKIIYGIVPDGRSYRDCPIGTYEANVDEYSGEEFVLYDFQNPSEFWVNKFDSDPYTAGTCRYLYTDLMPLGNRLVNRCVFMRSESTYIYAIEGVGIDAWSSYTLSFFRPYELGFHGVNFSLSHVIEGGKIVYKAMNYDGNMTGIDEVVADKGQRAYDGTYYNLMGQPVGKEVPTTPGIYIHNGNKILVR